MSVDKATLARKVWESVRRDRGLPLTELAAKALRFGAAAAAAPFHLRDCDVVGKSARTPGGPPIIDNRGRIVIGDLVQIISRFVPVRLVAAPGASLEIGDGCLVNYGAVISTEKRVVLGRRITIGPHVRVADHDEAGDLQAGAPAEVHIGDDVWLAARVRVLKGSRIGAGTVVAAGAVVSGDLPPNVVAAGSPARVLRKRRPDDSLPPPVERSAAHDSAIHALVHRTSVALGDLRARVPLRAADRVGANARVFGVPYVENRGRLEIGRDFTLSSAPVLSHMVVGRGASLVIGDRVSIGHGAALAADASITIEDDVHIGAMVMIMDTDFHDVASIDAASSPKTVVIERGASIGAGAILLKGSRVGRGARVAAGSVVVGDVAPGVLVRGVPARSAD
ncbi:hypothetical protein BH09MYX1_BH09MYX1_18670 [soil metagenome]